jgi:hypothetical protein
MTTEDYDSRYERKQRMEAEGIQLGSPAAERFMADNPVTDEVIDSEFVITEPEQKTTKRTLLNESIKQTEHLKSISNNVKFFFYVALISAILSIITVLRL